MKPALILLDLDNCISDDAWRIPRIDWSQEDKFKRYHNYSLLAAYDDFISPYAVLERDSWTEFPRRHSFIITTSRSEHYRALTEHWLKATRLPIARVMMRAEGDMRISRDVKKSFLDQYPIADISCAIDDRPDIVAMYKEHGLQTLLRAIHSVSAYVDPRTQEQHL